MELGQALHRFSAATMSVSVRAQGIFDANLDSLGQPRAGVPELRPAALQRRDESLAGNTLHLKGVARTFYR